MSDKVLKDHIVAFRIPKDQATVVTAMLQETPIMNVRSINQFFRKIGMDYVAGKMTYKNPGDAVVDASVSTT